MSNIPMSNIKAMSHTAYFPNDAHNSNNANILPMPHAADIPNDAHNSNNANIPIGVHTSKKTVIDLHQL
jgi:hypothetical protein